MYKKGYHHTEEEKEKIRQSKIGSKNPMYHKEFSTETRQRMSESQHNRIHNPNQWENMHKVRKGFKSTDETKDKIRLASTGNHSHLGFRHTFSEDTKSKMGEIQRLKWQDPEERDKRITAIFKAGRQVPNYKELLLLSYLNEVMPNSWRFVGNGQLKIGEKKKVPDFICDAKPNLLCEHFGNGFHTQDQVEPRIKYFSEYGYKTLIIWQNELHNKENVIERIKEFCT